MAERTPASATPTAGRASLVTLDTDTITITTGSTLSSPQRPAAQQPSRKEPARKEPARQPSLKQPT